MQTRSLWMVLNVFKVSNVYWDRKITSNFSDKISSKTCWKIKNVQTFNIKKHLIHNFVNVYNVSNVYWGKIGI